MTMGRLGRLKAQFRVITVIAALLTLAQAPAGAQLPDTKETANTAAPAPARSNARLDELLAAKDYLALAQALNSTPLTRRMDWLKSRLLNGGTVFLAYHYISALWLAGTQAQDDDPGKDMRVAAGLSLLYAYQLIAVDGQKCADSSAPAIRLRQLLGTTFQPITDYLKQQTMETKAKIVKLALRMEQFTAPKRKNDDFLCRGGLSELAASRAAGVKPVEAPPTHAHEAKGAWLLPPAPGWAPEFLPIEKYAPLQEKARASMREQLLALVK